MDDCGKRKVKMLSIYLRNKEINPSSYYRISQYLNDIDTEKVVRNLNSDKLYNLSLNSPNKFVRMSVQAILYIEMNLKFMLWSKEDIKKKNIVLVQREIIPRFCLPFVKKRLNKLYASCRVIWDFDDNILVGNEISRYEYDLLLKHASDIIVTSSNLSQMIIGKTDAKIHELPTTDSTIYKKIDNEVVEHRFISYDTTIKLVWLGTSGNINEVVRILPYIEQASQKIEKKIILTIISGVNPKLENSHFEIKFVKWSRETVIKELASSHIGIMPLKNNEYNAGKGGFKLIQYLSSALPVIGSEVGINKDIIKKSVGALIRNDDDWINAIARLSVDKQLYMDMSRSAVLLWKNEYSSEMVAQKLNEIIKTEEKE